VTYFWFTLTVGNGIQARLGSNGRILDVWNESDQARYQMNLLGEGETEASTWDNLLHIKNPAVILPRPFGLQTRGLGGVLVSIHDRRSSKIFCSYIHRVFVLVHYGQPYSKVYLERLSNSLARAQSLSTNQNWCVD
jgi:hypothetical protein